MGWVVLHTKMQLRITASFPVQVAMKFVKRSSVLEFIKVKYPFKTAKYSFP